MSVIVRDASMLEKGDVIQSKAFGYIQIIIENDKENKTIKAKGLQSEITILPYSVYEDMDSIYKGNLESVLLELNGML